MNDSMSGFYRRIRLRMRLAWLSESAQVYAPYLGLVVVAVFAVDWLTSWNGAIPTTGILLGGYLVSLGVASMLFRLTPWDVSRTAERGLGARAAFTTALEFDDPNNEIHRSIHQRAARIALSASASRAIPLPVKTEKLRQVAYVGILALVVAFLPGFVQGAALSPQAAAVLEAEAREVEKLAEAIERADVANSKEIATELQSLAGLLRDANTIEEGLTALNQSEKRLAANLDPRFLTQKAAVQGLARDLALRPLVENGPLDATSQLEGLADEIGQLSDPELRALQDRLADLAASQAAGNPTLSSHLSDASAALARRDLAGAQESLEGAALGQQTGLADARSQQAISETQRALSAMRGRLQGPGVSGTEGRAPGEGEGQGGKPDGQASGVISGAQPGDGDAAGQGGQGSVGSGQTDEEGSRAQTTNIYDPVDRGTLSELLEVNIRDGAAEGEVVGRADAPTSRGESVVPYARVLPDYLNEAADALTTLSLPPSMRKIVRNYFDILADEAR